MSNFDRTGMARCILMLHTGAIERLSSGPLVQVMFNI